jgi:hypothetical protein
MRIAVFTSGSLSGSCIEPDTSRRKTRLRGGVRPLSMRGACSPMSASRCRGFHGHGAISVVTENGCPFGASAYEKRK